MIERESPFLLPMKVSVLLPLIAVLGFPLDNDQLPQTSDTTFGWSGCDPSSAEHVPNSFVVTLLHFTQLRKGVLSRQITTEDSSVA
jgi:hypothetical protein